MSCGDDHTVLVSTQTQGGYVYAMGSNLEGKLGISNPDVKMMKVPTLVPNLKNIIKVSAGSSHTLALGANGKAYSWG